MTILMLLVASMSFSTRSEAGIGIYLMSNNQEAGSAGQIAGIVLGALGLGGVIAGSFSNPSIQDCTPANPCSVGCSVNISNTGWSSVRLHFRIIRRAEVLLILRVIGRL